MRAQINRLGVGGGVDRAPLLEEEGDVGGVGLERLPSGLHRLQPLPLRIRHVGGSGGRTATGQRNPQGLEKPEKMSNENLKPLDLYPRARWRSGIHANSCTFVGFACLPRRV